MNVSPGRSMLTKALLHLAEHRTAPPLPASRIFSIGASTMVPMFMRAWRATRSERTCTRPSLSRNSLR